MAENFSVDRDELLRRYVSLIAPGSVIRDGLERIQHSHTGALIVMGRNDLVDQVSTGGFNINADLTPTAMRELAKMDGALVLNSDLDRIEKAGVHLVPDGMLPTIETGTRHRTADRVSRQTGVPVVTVSAAMSTIALFIDGDRHAVEPTERTLARSSQAIATMNRYREKLDELLNILSALEISDQATVRDVALAAQKIEMLRRLETEVRGYIAALGIDGRLPEMQLMEVVTGLNEITQLLEEDYTLVDQESGAFSIARLSTLDDSSLIDLGLVAEVIGFGTELHLESRVSPKGYRLAAQLPRITILTARKLVDTFGSLQGLLGASTAELKDAGGLTDNRARTIHENLARLTDKLYDQTRF